MAKIPRQVEIQAATALAYKNVFESPEGQLVLVDLIKFSGLLEASPQTVEQANYSNGCRAMALRIIDQMGYDVPRLLQLTQARLDEIGEEG